MGFVRQRRRRTAGPGPPHVGFGPAHRRAGRAAGARLPKPLHLLIAESEPEEARNERRGSTGRSSGETYVDALRALEPDARFDLYRPHEPGGLPAALDDYDGVFLSGSPLHVYHDNHAVRANVCFMRAVFDAGVPSFGSCAGLHIAVAAAGGTVRRNPDGHEVGLARRVAPTVEGARHPMLEGRPASYDAPAVHGDEVETLPEGSVRLAGNSASPVQAAEIRHGAGTFWGVQYHPELPLGQLAQAIRRQAGGLVKRGLARDEADVEAQAALFESLGREPKRLDLAWRLGVDREVAEDERRTVELANTLRHLVRPVQARRGRG